MEFEIGDFVKVRQEDGKYKYFTVIEKYFTVIEEQKPNDWRTCLQYTLLPVIPEYEDSDWSDALSNLRVYSYIAADIEYCTPAEYILHLPKGLKVNLKFKD